MAKNYLYMAAVGHIVLLKILFFCYATASAISFKSCRSVPKTYTRLNLAIVILSYTILLMFTVRCARLCRPHGHSLVGNCNF